MRCSVLAEPLGNAINDCGDTDFETAAVVGYVIGADANLSEAASLGVYTHPHLTSAPLLPLPTMLLPRHSIISQPSAPVATAIRYSPAAADAGDDVFACATPSGFFVQRIQPYGEAYRRGSCAVQPSRADADPLRPLKNSELQESDLLFPLQILPLFFLWEKGGLRCSHPRLSLCGMTS